MTKENKKELTIISFGRGNVIMAEPPYQVVERWGRPWIYFRDCATVLRWGTKEGLGQIATNGPTPDTRLNAVPHDIRIPADAIHCEYSMTDRSVEKFVPMMDQARIRILEGE